ncbi:MAG: glycerate kinase [Paucibacter sp.]|nr:glycerate kinase [Roseateles sp.]
MTITPRALLRQLYDAAVARALPNRVLAEHLPPPPDRARGRTLVLGAGKAGGSMLQALEAAWPADAPLSGLVVTRYGHSPVGWQPQRVELVEASHPVPGDAGQRAAARMLELTRGLSEHDLVVVLISGGGSALLSLPAPGLTLEDKRVVSRALLSSGATIGEMNCVRKHLSAIKGGRLAAACAPARVVTLMISDVPGDDPAVIASGPTVADATSCAEALEILRRYGISVPDAARAGLASGAFESIMPGDARLANSRAELIATPQQSLEAAADAARAMGLEAHILSDAIEGESHVVGRVHAALARQIALREQPFKRPCVILSGGETTVTVHNSEGRGGRATEFLLGCALGLQGMPGIYAFAADTDGIDGMEDNAGAIVMPDTLARAHAAGQSATQALERNNAYDFFAALGDLVVTGPTLTNVNDFRALLIL